MSDNKIPPKRFCILLIQRELVRWKSLKMKLKSLRIKISQIQGRRNTGINSSAKRTTVMSTVVTARLRSTTGGYVFTGVYLFRRGGGIPPSPVQSPVPGPAGGRFSSHPGQDRAPWDRTGGAPRPWQNRGYFHPLPPAREQVMLRRRRYTSCSHAGGLPCLLYFQIRIRGITIVNLFGNWYPV